MSPADTVKRISVLAVAMGTLMVVSALPNLAMRALVSTDSGLQGRLPPPLDMLDWMLRHRVPLASLQAALGMVVLVAGVGVRRRQHWARTALEAVTWLALIGYLGAGGLWVYRSIEASWSASSVWVIPFAVIGLVAIVFWAVIFLLVIRFLRRPGTREALTPGDESA